MISVGPDDPVMTAHQVAERLSIHYKTLLRLVRDKELRAVKHGNRIYIRRSWVEEFLTPTPNERS